MPDETRIAVLTKRLLLDDQKDGVSELPVLEEVVDDVVGFESWGP